MPDEDARSTTCRWLTGLRHWRDRHGLSDRQLAEILGVANNTVSAWLRRRPPAIPSPKYRKLIQDITGVDMTPPKRPGPKR